MKRLDPDRYINLMMPSERLRFANDPELLLRELQVGALEAPPLVAIDEVQLVPDLMNVLQVVIDEGLAQCVITGSSARRLRRAAPINLLPGRVMSFYLGPLDVSELEGLDYTLETRLSDGCLPAVVQESSPDVRQLYLRSYVNTYLKEEIHAEAAVRNLDRFARFLQLAALESGNILNFSAISRDLGVGYKTVQDYFQLLDDTLIGQWVQPWCRSKGRKRLNKNPKFLWCDGGIRRVAAQEGSVDSPLVWLRLFEQYVGMVLLGAARNAPLGAQVFFWRDHTGPEVDWVWHDAQQLIPIEVKWTDRPQPQDAKHLHVFMKDNPEAKQGWVVCRAPRAVRLSERVVAIPWHALQQHLGAF